MPTLQDVMDMAESFQGKAIEPIPNRCVKVRNRNASCQRCVDVCPSNAITIKFNSITIDNGACVACGACLDVCPTSALFPLDPSDDRLTEDVTSATRVAGGDSYFVCARMAARGKGETEKFATVPCLARLEESLLVRLVAQGSSRIVLVDGTCKTCKYRRTGPAIDAMLKTAETLLETVGCDVAIERTSELPDAIKAEDDRAVIGKARRSFFSNAGSTVKNVARDAAEKAITQRLNQALNIPEKSLRERLGVTKVGSLPRFEPLRNMEVLDSLYALGDPVKGELDSRLFGSIELDYDCCSGCGMCLMFCPTGALAYSHLKDANDDKPQGARTIEFSAADCVQCQLCTDVCMPGCLTIRSTVSTEELFDFEPKTLEIAPPAARSALFGSRF